MYIRKCPHNWWVNSFQRDKRFGKQTSSNYYLTWEYLALYKECSKVREKFYIVAEEVRVWKISSVQVTTKWWIGKCYWCWRRCTCKWRYRVDCCDTNNEYCVQWSSTADGKRNWTNINWNDNSLRGYRLLIIWWCNSTKNKWMGTVNDNLTQQAKQKSTDQVSLNENLKLIHVFKLPSDEKCNLPDPVWYLDWGDLTLKFMQLDLLPMKFWLWLLHSSLFPPVLCSN